MFEKARPAIRDSFGADAHRIEKAGEFIGSILKVVEAVDAHHKRKRR
jgi:hypothetical protein